MEFLSIRTLVLAGAASLAVGVASTAADPEPLEAADCGGPGEVLCKKNESCAWFVFYEQCTTEYDYYDDADIPNTI